MGWGGHRAGQGVPAPRGGGTRAAAAEKVEAKKPPGPQRVLIKGVFKPLCPPNFRCLSPAPGAGKAAGKRAGNAEVC